MRWIPRLMSLIFLWGAVVTVIVYVEPELFKDVFIPGSYSPFFLLLTIALWYTLALMARSVVYGLLVTLTLLAGIILSMLQLMHWGLAITLGLTLVIESWYIYRRHEKVSTNHEQKN